MLDLTTGVRRPVAVTSPFDRVVRWDGNTPTVVLGQGAIVNLVTGERHDLSPVESSATFDGDPWRPSHAFLWRSFCIEEKEVETKTSTTLACVRYQFQLHRVDLDTFADDVVTQADGYSIGAAVSPDGRWLATAYRPMADQPATV